MDDETLLRELIDAGDEVAHLAHRLEDLATRIDRLIAAAGAQWAPEIFDRIDVEESAALRCGNR